MTRDVDVADVDIAEIQKPQRYTETWLVRPEDLVVNYSENGRRKTTIDEPFIQSMLGGQIEPIKVRPVPGKSGVWKVVLGYRRTMAALEINRRKLLPHPFMLRVELAKSLNDESAYLLNLRENKDRKATTPVDDAANIVRLKELFGWTDKAIGDFYGKTGAWVSKTRKIMQLPEKFLTLIEDGGLAAAQAEALVDADEAFREQLYAEFKAGSNPSAGDIKQRAREEGATDSTRDASLKPKHITGFYESIIDDEEAPEKLKEFAAVSLKWLRGNTRMSSSKYAAELVERLKMR